MEAIGRFTALDSQFSFSLYFVRLLFPPGNTVPGAARNISKNGTVGAKKKKKGEHVSRLRSQNGPRRPTPPGGNSIRERGTPGGEGMNN